MTCASFAMNIFRSEVSDLTTTTLFIEDSVIIYKKPNPAENAITLLIKVCQLYLVNNFVNLYLLIWLSDENTERGKR